MGKKTRISSTKRKHVFFFAKVQILPLFFLPGELDKLGSFFFLIYFFKARPRESIHEIRAAGREKKKRKNLNVRLVIRKTKTSLVKKGSRGEIGAWMIYLYFFFPLSPQNSMEFWGDLGRSLFFQKRKNPVVFSDSRVFLRPGPPRKSNAIFGRTGALMSREKHPPGPRSLIGAPEESEAKPPTKICKTIRLIKKNTTVIYDKN